MSETLRIIPLGGVGEVGKNITVIEVGGEILVVDCGLAFPDPEMLGIDLVIPDVSYLEERRDRVRGIVLTHGHEDHTGALPYVLPKIPGTPIYATRLTEGLVHGKLKEHKLLDSTPLHVVEPGVEFAVGPFRLTPFRVNHSIPDGVGYAIATPIQAEAIPHVLNHRPYRRLQVRPHAARRPPRRPGADRRDRQPGGRLPPLRLDASREGGLHAVGDDRRRQPASARG